MKAHDQGDHEGDQEQGRVLDTEEHQQLEVRAEPVQQSNERQRTEEPDRSLHRGGELCPTGATAGFPPPERRSRRL